jgi:hypothetical protein
MWKEGKPEELADSCIMDSSSPDEIFLCIQVGLLCVQDNPHDRPHMSAVVFVLENGSTTLPAPIRPSSQFERRNTEVEQTKVDTENSVNNITLTKIQGR